MGEWKEYKRNVLLAGDEIETVSGEIYTVLYEEYDYVVVREGKYTYNVAKSDIKRYKRW